MLCTNCHSEVGETAKFCAECGTPSGLACPYCRFRNPADAVTCAQCERALNTTAVNAAAERRQITVMFIDLVGSSALSETMDPEDLRELIAAYQTTCADAIERYDGHIAQYLGDGVLVYFGYPAAHEDDAVRALQSGLDILDGMKEIKLAGVRPRVRIGIHTGVVVVGDVGSGQRREQLALGEAPNVAARLQSEAEPDTLLISDATRKLVLGHFELEDRGSRMLKGISRPTQLFRVRGRSHASTRFDALAASGLAPFIGRGRETDAIRAAWQAASAGEGQTVLFRGEPGIGKSRLVGAAKEIANGQPHELLEAECSPYDVNSALHPITKMLARRLQLESLASAEERLGAMERFLVGRGVRATDAAPLISALLGIPAGTRYPTLDMTPARRRERTLEILADLLLRTPDGAPILLIVEDLHWADLTTMQLVGVLVARQTSAPLLLLCTSRPEGVVTWTPAAHWHPYDVTALPKDDARALIAGVAHRKMLPEAVMREVIERSGGVPLFVEAVTRTIIETGVLTELEDRYELAGPLPPGLIPSTLHDSLMARIDRLGPDKPVAQLASVIGREFEFDLLLSVSDKSANGLRHVLDRLVELDLVGRGRQEGSGTYIFKHALIQDAAYGSLLRKTRQDFHGRIARALLDHFPELADARPELVAQHLSAANQGAEAARYWLRAGQSALGRAALNEAIAHLKHGLSHIEEVPEPERFALDLEFQMAIAPALTALQGWASPELDRAYARAGELVDLVQGTAHRFPVRWGIWAYHFVAGRVGESLPLAREVLDMALASGVPMLIPPGRHATACSYCYHGEFRESAAHADAGLAALELEQERLIARNFGFSSCVCLYSFRGDTSWMLGFPDQALRTSDASLVLARELNHMPSLAWALSYQTWFHHLYRDVDRILTIGEEVASLADKEGFAFWEPLVAVYRGWAMTMKGDHENGIAHLRGGIERYRAAGNGCTQIHMIGALAEALWEAGNPDEAMSALADGMALAKSTQEGFYEPELYRLRGEFLLARAASSPDAAAAIADARRSIDTALEMARKQEARSLELRALTTLVHLEQQHGNPTAAIASLAELYGGFAEGLDTPDLLSARFALGQYGDSEGYRPMGTGYGTPSIQGA